MAPWPIPFLLTPLREGRPGEDEEDTEVFNFYSRPCGRGDNGTGTGIRRGLPISTHAPAGGATQRERRFQPKKRFLLTPLREGRLTPKKPLCQALTFLLTPLREGRPRPGSMRSTPNYFYSRPCGRGDRGTRAMAQPSINFYSRPCGRGDSNFPQVRHEVLRQIAER